MLGNFDQRMVARAASCFGAAIGLTLCLGFCASLACAQADSPRQQTDAQQTEHTIQLLQTGHGAQLLEKPIVLFHVPVAEPTSSSIVSPKTVGKTHKQGFWIGAPGSRKILVRIPAGVLPVNPANITAEIHKNALVDITGTVKKAPDSITLKSLYDLNHKQIQMVKEEGVIVEAGSIIVRSQ